MKRSPLILVVGLLGTLAFSNANAQWMLDGRLLCSTGTVQQYPASCSDGAGGAIIAWQDARNGTQDIYASRIGHLGNLVWTGACGPVVAGAGNQTTPVIVSDGAGGAIIVWEDSRNGGVDLYIQRIDFNGKALWKSDLAVCTGTGAHAHPSITSDGQSGAIIAWDDTRSGNADIYVARFDIDGKRLWTLNGVALCTATNNQDYPSIASDGANGAIVVWHDERVSSLQSDIYARRVSSNGTPQWTADGVAVCTAGASQNVPKIVSDGAGGGVMVWQDRRTSHTDIWAQRTNGAGSMLWAANGVVLCGSLGDQYDPIAIADGAGGAIVSWRDMRNGLSNADIYARRVNAGGTALWTTDGIAVCTASGHQLAPTMTTDGANGVILTWQDQRVAGDNIYARRVDALGNLFFMLQGSEVCLATGAQVTPVIASGGSGDVIIAWSDSRGGTAQVYAQRMSAAGAWGNPEPVITSIVDTPGDEGKHVTIRWTNLDRPGEDYLYEVLRNDNGAWTTIDWIPDNGTNHYSVNEPTLDDSTCWQIFQHNFQVRGYISSLEPSNVVLGRSFDNIAPPAPVLDSHIVPPGLLTLHWSRAASDIMYYAIYMSQIPVQPPVQDYYDTANDTVYTIASPGGTDQYWSVVALDLNCNRSPVSNTVAFLLPNTPVGNNVHIQPWDENGSGLHNVGITFANVSQSGRTNLEVTPTGPSLPGSFTAGDGRYYDVSTLASFNGTIQVCIQYDQFSLSVPEESLQLLHYDTSLVPPAWVNITTSLDTDFDVICGTTTSLSPFVIGAGSVTGVGDQPLPKAFALHGNVPNPFNPSTTIGYEIPPAGADVNISIYDVAGRRVRTLVHEHRPAGVFSVPWNGDDDRGQRVASGVYFYRMRAGSFVETRKMVLLK
jgi:hypothetical protein